MAITWSTTKTANGYEASVRRVVWGESIEPLKTATFRTRAQAVGFAKRWALYYRRGGA